MSTARTALDEMSTKGEFKRTDAGYRNFVEAGSRFEPEGRLRVQFLQHPPTHPIFDFRFFFQLAATTFTSLWRAPGRTAASQQCI
jgi:hypothetical protein